MVLGAAAPVPFRAKAAEAPLVDAASAEAAAAVAEAMPLTQNAYKLPLFRTLVRRAILAAAGD